MVSRRTFIKQIGLATAGVALTLSGCEKESNEEVSPVDPEPEPDPEPDPDDPGSGSTTESEPETRIPISEADESEPSDSSLLWGLVYDSDGYLVPGVVVSDGYTCVVTDEGGRYEISPSSLAVQVNICVPAKYEITLNSDGYPDFWKTINGDQKRYDFVLNPLAGGIEKEFYLLCVADPQTQTTTHAQNFESMYIPDIKEEVAKLEAKLPVYGFVLGDVVWNNASNYLKDTILPRMKTDWSKNSTGLTSFMVIGNHDHSYHHEDDIDAQRDFEATFGPVNYSVDRGNVHIITMDNIRFTSMTEYQTGFRDDQLEWLKQDLKYVSSDKMLIFCTHSPMRNRSGSDVPHVQDVLAQLDKHPGYHIMSGHIHVTANYDSYSTHYEHNQGALCGGFWRGQICADGTPNGYGVYTVKDTEITNWYYKSALYDDEYQIRLYHGQDVFFPGYVNNFQFKYNDEKVLIADVFNADNSWRVQVYEDGVLLGRMTKFSGRDAWAAGYFFGPQSRSFGSDYDRETDHLYYYTLSHDTKTATNIEVVATDQFGNVYRQTEITSNSNATFAAF